MILLFLILLKKKFYPIPFEMCYENEKKYVNEKL